MSQSLSSDIATESEWIEPFFCYYPERENLNSKQVACYKKIKVELDSGRFVYVGDNQSYIFLYINEVLKKVKKKKDVANIVTVLESLRALYKGDELLIFFIEHWLADSYVIQGKYNEAMELYKLRDHVDALWSLKNKLNIPLSLKDLPSQLWKNHYTSFVNDKLEQADKYLELAIKEKGYDNNWIQEIIKKKTEKLDLAEDKKIMEYPLFRATRYGYHLNKLNTDIQFVYYGEIIGWKKLEKICKELSREAENLLRVALGVPRVGEGWVSETALYYKVKEFLSDYEVVHHYRAEWLGRQHLDIYIPKLHIGIEYQGEQHFKPIDIFGGLDAFLKNQKRDAEKREKCKKVNVTLIEVLPNYDFESVKYEIRKHIPTISI